MALDARWVMHCYEAVYCTFEGAVRCPANTFNWTQWYLVPSTWPKITKLK